MFLFKKKKLVLECFTKVEQLSKIGIPKASEYIPEWWKSIPKVVNGPNAYGMAVPKPTLKTCAGFIDLYRRGNIVPLWSDLIIDVHEDTYTWQFSDPHSDNQIRQHEEYQFTSENFKFDHFHHAKIESPWLVKCNKDVKFLAIEPTYNNLLNDYGIRYLPGVVDFKDQHGINVNMFIPAEIRRIKMNFLDPLYHWICLDDTYDVEFKPILVDAVEYQKIERETSFHPHFIGNFSKLKKCPFKGNN
jgi:hypothetical protein